MKHLVQMINEGDIDRCERKYREFINMCKTYDPNLNLKELWVKKTTKNNWAVYVGLKKLFVTSFSTLDDDVIKKNNIKICTESLNESSEKYELVFMQYDPDVQEEYENGDVDDDELHDSMYEDEDVKHIFITASSDKDAERKATKELAKIVNKYPEVCAVCVYYDNADSGDCQTIFI